MSKYTVYLLYASFCACCLLRVNKRLSSINRRAWNSRTKFNELTDALRMCHWWCYDILTPRKKLKFLLKLIIIDNSVFVFCVLSWWNSFTPKNFHRRRRFKFPSLRCTNQSFNTFNDDSLLVPEIWRMSNVFRNSICCTLIAIYYFWCIVYVKYDCVML